MSLSDIFTSVAKTFKSNAPEILTAVGVTGVVTTSYLTAKAAVKAAKLLDQEMANVVNGAQLRPPLWTVDKKERVKHDVKVTWKCYIPPVVSGAVTIACIIGSQKSSSRRTAVAVTAYSLTEKAFSEYREKVVEQLGDTKEQKIRDEIAQEHVTNNPPRDIIIVGEGNVLCREEHTGRYFRSDIETLRRAENDVNSMALNGLSKVSLDDLYDLIGLPHTSKSDLEGWDFEKNMHLQFSTTLTPNGEPCLVFEYNYVKPLYD